MGDDYGSQTLHGITGGDTPAIIFREFMAHALANTPASDFNVPPGAADIANQGYHQPAAKEAPKEEVKDDKDKDKDKSEASSEKSSKSDKSKSSKEKKRSKE